MELTEDEQMRQVLGVMPVRRLQRTAVRCEGPLVRRHRFTGWKPVWVRRVWCDAPRLTAHRLWAGPRTPRLFSRCTR